MDSDDYFKDFKLDKYRFIVVNKKSLTPLVWLFNDTMEDGPLFYRNSKNENIEFRDPFVLGLELTHYLESPRNVPFGIIENGDNIIENWFEDD